MIDLKNKREALIQALQESLLEYKHLFLHQTGVKAKWAPLQLVISGGPPIHLIERQKEGFFFADLPVKRRYSSQEQVVFCSRRSAAWKDLFTWNGHGTMPLDEKKLLEINITGKALKISKDQQDKNILSISNFAYRVFNQIKIIDSNKDKNDDFIPGYLR